MRVDPGPLEFEWDRGNAGKNGKHGVADSESEEAFFDPDKVLLSDSLHSQGEERSILIGKTKSRRLLFVAFTKRGHKIRIISARDLNRREIRLYEKKS